MGSERSPRSAPGPRCARGEAGAGVWGRAGDGGADPSVGLTPLGGPLQQRCPTEPPAEAVGGDGAAPARSLQGETRTLSSPGSVGLPGVGMEDREVLSSCCWLPGAGAQEQGEVSVLCSEHPPCLHGTWDPGVNLQ